MQEQHSVRCALKETCVFTGALTRSPISVYILQELLALSPKKKGRTRDSNITLRDEGPCRRGPLLYKESGLT